MRTFLDKIGIHVSINRTRSVIIAPWLCPLQQNI